MYLNNPIVDLTLHLRGTPAASRGNVSKLNRQVRGFSEAAFQSLCRYHYPGNVRELENLIERALLLSSGALIKAGDWLPKACPNLVKLSKLEQLEREAIIRLLKLYKGDRTLAARNLGISRTTLWRHMKDSRIQPTDEDADVSK